MSSFSELQGHLKKKQQVLTYNEQEYLDIFGKFAFPTMKIDRNLYLSFCFFSSTSPGKKIISTLREGKKKLCCCLSLSEGVLTKQFQKYYCNVVVSKLCFSVPEFVDS